MLQTAQISKGILSLKEHATTEMIIKSSISVSIEQYLKAAGNTGRFFMPVYAD